ncbi:MAG TPA: hypothetical protein VJS69_07825 [Candidatus Krumholzibacteria bacterium]|nr:hypothetical protein [Candidatus Krumholzibacteria bacterium]
MMSRKGRLIGCAVLALILGGCHDNEPPRQERTTAQDTTRMSGPSITEVLARLTPELMKIPGVVGTAQGEQDGRPAIIVYVKAETDSLVMAVPSSLEGFPVKLQASGPIGLH